jgi:hypothetical protein
MKTARILCAPGLQALILVVCCVFGASSVLFVHPAEAAPLQADLPGHQLGSSALALEFPTIAIVRVEEGSPTSQPRLRGVEQNTTEYYLEFQQGDTTDVETEEEAAPRRTEYYLEFESDEGSSTPDRDELIQDEPDTTDYYLEFESKDLPDSAVVEPDVQEIEIDDEGVRVEPPEARNRISIRVGAWDDPENHICDRTEFDGTRGKFDWGLGLSYQRVDGI